MAQKSNLLMLLGIHAIVCLVIAADTNPPPNNNNTLSIYETEIQVTKDLLKLYEEKLLALQNLKKSGAHSDSSKQLLSLSRLEELVSVYESSVREESAAARSARPRNTRRPKSSKILQNLLFEKHSLTYTDGPTLSPEPTTGNETVPAEPIAEGNQINRP